MQHKAESEPLDRVARDRFTGDAPIAQEGWRCPRAGYQADPESLSPKHRETLVAVEKLTGAKCSTCPNFYARMPWVHEAVNARRWRDKGALRERVGWPSTVLVRAIDLVDRSDAMRVRDDLERDRQKREADAEQAKRDREHGR
jgi:hypothetical protein